MGIASKNFHFRNEQLKLIDICNGLENTLAIACARPARTNIIQLNKLTRQRGYTLALTIKDTAQKRITQIQMRFKNYL